MMGCTSKALLKWIRITGQSSEILQGRWSFIARAVAPGGVRSWRGYPLLSSLKASDPGGLICELSPRDKARAGGSAYLERKRGQGLIP